MNAVGHRDAIHADGPGHLQIIFGIPDHDRLRHRHATLGHQLFQHQRMRLGAGEIGGATGNEPATAGFVAEDTVEPTTTFSGRHRQPAFSITPQAPDTLGHAGKKRRRYSIDGPELMPIGFAQTILLLKRHVRKQYGDRFGQS